MKNLAKKKRSLNCWWQDQARPGLLSFQRILILPIFILSLAGLLIVLGNILVRLGLAWANILFYTGSAVFDYWPLLLAVSLAYGLSRNRQGITAFSAVISYSILAAGAGQINLVLSVQTGYSYLLDTGWVIGLFAGFLPLIIRRLADQIRLPKFLSFFSGERLIPILSLMAALLIGPLIGLVWHHLSNLLYHMAHELPSLDAGGSFLYAFLSRLLQPLGLNRVLEQVILNEYGSYIDLSGKLITGERDRFLAGDPTAGYYTAGSFSVLIFAVPAAAAVLLLVLEKGQRKLWSGLIVLAAIPSIIGGIAIPFEYLLLIFSPLLFVAYAFLHGVSAFLAWTLQLRHGFSLAPGLADYIEHWPIAANPLYLSWLGLVMSALLFTLFYLLVMRLGIASPGRLSQRMLFRKNKVRLPAGDKQPEQDETEPDDSGKENQGDC